MSAESTFALLKPVKRGAAVCGTKVQVPRAEAEGPESTLLNLPAGQKELEAREPKVVAFGSCR